MNIVSRKRRLTSIPGVEQIMRITFPIKTMRVIFAALAVLAASPCIAKDSGVDAKKKVRRYAKAHILPFVGHFDDLMSLCRDQNKLREKWPTYTEEWKEWGPEQAKSAADGYTKSEYLWTIAKDAGFRSKHLAGKIADRLREFQNASNGAIAEIFVTDGRGGNIVQSGLTTDWFQGDEDKFTRAVGTKSLVLDEVQFDSSAQSTGIHVSVPMIDNHQVECVAIFLVVVEKIEK